MKTTISCCDLQLKLLKTRRKIKNRLKSIVSYTDSLLYLLTEES